MAQPLLVDSAEMLATPPDISHLETENDDPVDNLFSEKQQRLLTRSLYASWQVGETKRPFLAMANVGLFYSIHRPAVVPDVLVSLDVEAPEEMWEKANRSYMVWVYGKTPEVVVEVVSNRKGGEAEGKVALYAQIGIPYYIIFDPETQLGGEKLRVLELRIRDYVERDELWLPELGLGLILWNGEFEGTNAAWLRWCDEEGRLLLTGVERAEREQSRANEAQHQADEERQRANEERQRANEAQRQVDEERQRTSEAQRQVDEERQRTSEAQRQVDEERQRAERLAARLREAGIDPDSL